MIGKTTHEMANELLALPDVPLVIEGWCQMDGHEMSADMTEYDPTGTAIIWQKLISGNCLDAALTEVQHGPI